MLIKTFILLKSDFDAGQLCKMNFDPKNNEYLVGLIGKIPKDLLAAERTKNMDSRHE